MSTTTTAAGKASNRIGGVSSKALSNKQETSKQAQKLAIQEIDELRGSLRYAEFLLEKTRHDKDAVEAELREHDARVAAVRQELQSKEDENKGLGRQLEAAAGQAHFANMATAKVQELARGKLF